MVVRREDAERFIAAVRDDDPEVAAKLSIEELDVPGIAAFGCDHSLLLNKGFEQFLTCRVSRARSRQHRRTLAFGALVGHEREGRMPQTRMNTSGACRDRTGDLRLANSVRRESGWVVIRQHRAVEPSGSVRSDSEGRRSSA